MSKILVIEDETEVRENILELLSEEGYQVVGARDGDEGVRLVWKEMPDLIICDILMPTLDGYGVLAKISQDIRLASIPFLFLTARIGRDDLRKGMGLGADDYIMKPFSRSELLQAISARLGRMQKLESFAQKKLIDLRKGISTQLPNQLLTPLSVALGYSEVLQDRIEELGREEIRGLARDIHKATQRLIHLVENYLLFAELELILADPQKTEQYRQISGTAVNSYLQRISQEKANELGRSEDLSISLQPGEVTVLEAHLGKAVEELVDNALRYSAKKSPVIISGEAKPAKGMYQLNIVDQGRGMTPEQIRSIDGFIQYDRHLILQGGAGIGLALVKLLTNLYQGSLSIISKSGQGCQVEVQFPLKKIESHQDQSFSRRML